MPESWEETPETNGMKKLRKQYEEQQAQIKLLMEQNSKLMAVQNTVSVSDTLAKNGLDPRVARFYPSDAATDEESVTKWVDENKDIFGARRTTENGQVAQDTLTDAERRGYQAINDISAYESAMHMDLKSQLDKIEYDPQNPDKAVANLMNKVKEFEGTLNM